MTTNKKIEYLLFLLKGYREEQNLSRSKLAKLASMTNSKYIEEIENGDDDFKKLTFENFYMLCQAFEVNPIFFLKEIRERETKGYIHIKGKNWDRDDVSEENKPTKVVRREGVLNSQLKYYTLLDALNHEQTIFSDFQMSLLTDWKPNSKSKPHYQYGEEFLIVLDGSLTYNFIDNHAKGVITDSNSEKSKWKKSKELNSIYSNKSSENYIWFKSWFPHQAVSGNENTTVLIINFDTRGERSLYSYSDTEKESTYVIEEKSKLNSQSLLRGLGIKLKQSRLKSGLTSKFVVEKINGLTTTDLYKIENNKANPSLKVIFEISKILDIDYTELFPDINEPVKYGNINKLTSPESHENVLYENLKFVNLIGAENNTISINKNTPILKIKLILGQVRKESKFDYLDYDIAFFVLKGIFEFKFKLDENKIESKTLEPWDTIYIKKGKEHYFKQLIDDDNSEALIIHI